MKMDLAIDCILQLRKHSILLCGPQNWLLKYYLHPTIEYNWQRFQNTNLHFSDKPEEGEAFTQKANPEMLEKESGESMNQVFLEAGEFPSD